MGLHLYSIGFDQPIPGDAFQRLVAALPTPMQPRIHRFRRWQDAHANLLGKHLLRIALRDAGTPAGLHHLQYTAQDKPYLPQGPHFNISHSGTRVVCLLSTTGSVGIDIELIHPIGFEDFQTQFTPVEWTAIRSAPDPIAAFFRFWTAKESLIKADGRGLNIPLLNLDVTEYRPILIDGNTWSFHPLHHFPGYAAHYSIEAADPTEITYRELSPAEL